MMILTRQKIWLGGGGRVKSATLLAGGLSFGKSRDTKRFWLGRGGEGCVTGAGLSCCCLALGTRGEWSGCCGENSLSPHVLHCFSYWGWAFARQSDHCTGTFSTPDLTRKDPHHLLRCLGKTQPPPEGASPGCHCSAPLSSAASSGFLLHLNLTAGARPDMPRLRSFCYNFILSLGLRSPLLASEPSAPRPLLQSI